MAGKDRSAFRSGLLMLASVFLIVCVIVGIKGLSWIRDPTVDYLVAFDLKTNIGGLRVGDEVRVGGFKVGEVKRIKLQQDADPKHPPYYLLISFSVPKKYSLREDAKIRIDGTLTGTSWLNFEDIGKGPMLTESHVLIGAPSSTSELLASFGGLGADASPLLK